MNPIFTRSNETAKIVQLFAGMSIDAPMSFKDASRKLGFAISAASGAYHSARRIATKENGVVIDGVRGFGFQRLSGSNIVKRTYYHDGVIRRRARRASTETAAAVSQNLTHNEMKLATEKLSRYAIIADLSAPANARSNRFVVPEPPAAAHADNRSLLAAAG